MTSFLTSFLSVEHVSPSPIRLWWIFLYINFTSCFTNSLSSVLSSQWEELGRELKESDHLLPPEAQPSCGLKCLFPIWLRKHLTSPPPVPWPLLVPHTPRRFYHCRPCREAEVCLLWSGFIRPVAAWWQHKPAPKVHELSRCAFHFCRFL